MIGAGPARDGVNRVVCASSCRTMTEPKPKQVLSDQRRHLQTCGDPGTTGEAEVLTDQTDQPGRLSRYDRWDEPPDADQIRLVEYR
jgi:hypothetical protein